MASNWEGTICVIWWSKGSTVTEGVQYCSELMPGHGQQVNEGAIGLGWENATEVIVYSLL